MAPILQGESDGGGLVPAGPRHGHPQPRRQVRGRGERGAAGAGHRECCQVGAAQKGGNGVMVLMWLCQMLWPLRCEVQLSVRRGRLRHQVRIGHNLDTGKVQYLAFNQNAMHNSELIVFRNIRQSLLSNPLEL